MWAIGCIYAELLSLRPIFKGDEAKLDSKKTLPFQRDQMGKICEVLGPVKGASPARSFAVYGELTLGEVEQWAGIVHMPEYKTYLNSGPYVYLHRTKPEMIFDTLVDLAILHPRRCQRGTPPDQTRLRVSTSSQDYLSGIQRRDLQHVNP